MENSTKFLKETFNLTKFNKNIIIIKDNNSNNNNNNNNNQKSLTAKL
jgi:hypothetical protein